MTTWYDNLAKPPLTPPKKAFGPVWTILYLFVFSALVLYFLSPGKQNLIVVTFVLLLHFTTSFSWTKLFFGRKKVLAALVDLCVIDITLGIVIFLFLQVSTLAGCLLLPYLGWSLFATYINGGILYLNSKKSRNRQNTNRQWSVSSKPFRHQA